MAELHKVDPSMFDAIYRELLCGLDPARPEAEWRRIVAYEWDCPEDYRGFVLLDDGRPVGFLGLIFSTIPVGESQERFCNVTSWIVQDSHRGEAALLAFALRGLKEYTITNLSPNEAAHKVFSSLRFKVLETHTRILLPLHVFSRRSWRPRCAITDDTDSIAAMLDDPEKRLLEDHLPYARHLAVSDDSGYCYVIYTLRPRRGMPSARFHFMSDPDLLFANLSSVQAFLMKRDRSMFVEMDERFLEGRDVRGGYKRKLIFPRLFRSPRLDGSQVTDLYSERILLNLG
jgi:hypothetical protein